MSVAPTNSPPPPLAPWRTLAIDLAQCLRFYTRLPAPRLPWEGDPYAAPDFTRVPRMLPLTGAIVGATGGVMLMAAGMVGLSPMAAAALSLVALVLATGALHEDGLADMADGFGGGTTPERRLEIMADSRVGAYGVVAIGLALLLRFAALASLAAQAGFVRAALAIIAAAAVSRVVGLLPLWALPPARPGGKSAAVGRPSDGTMGAAFACALVLAALLLAQSFGPGRAILAFAIASATALPIMHLAKVRIGGQTGDVVGATVMVAEIAFLLILSAGGQA